MYLLFLLVTLLANYGDASSHGHAYRLQSALKQELASRAFLAITRCAHPGQPGAARGRAMGSGRACV